MRSTSVLTLIAASAAVGVGLTVIAAQRTPDPTAGRALYLTSCAGCHLPDLSGRNEAPALTGNRFSSRWGARASDLAVYIQKAMPPDDAGSLSDEAAADLAAYLVNPGAAGNAPAQPGSERPTARTGLMVAGEVKNYIPVTDAQLRNPDPGDWLMARRNYQGWSYSPLSQITRENVGRLRLAWVWAMAEGGWNEPMPVVHNGIVYLANTGNTIQAIDGQTGELIWENRIGPEPGALFGASRSLAIYQDKIFHATTDARLVALDARTGKIVWQTAIADSRKGYGNTSGPLVLP
jgi:alcohol dehydrogenase (cytochrome c)